MKSDTWMYLSGEHDPFRAWKLKVLTQEEFEKLSWEKRMRYLCGFGLLAPTTHNTSPQLFRIGAETSLEIWLDRKLLLPASDKEGRQGVISVGCVIENIVLAARAYGIAVEVMVDDVQLDQVQPFELNGGVDERMRLARIDFEEIAAEGDEVFLRAMLERKVCRSEYDGSVLSDEAAGVLNEPTGEFDGLEVKVVEAALMKQAFGRFQKKADKSVIEMKQFREELADGWFLLNEDKGSVRGMRGVEFGMDDAATKRLFEGLHNTKKLLPDDLDSFGRVGELGIRTASALVVISGKQEAVGHWINAGRLYERLALQLGILGYVHAVHAAITETGYKPIWVISKMVRKSILRSDYVPMMVFRVGKPKRKEDLKRPHSARPDLESMFILD